MRQKVLDQVFVIILLLFFVIILICYYFLVTGDIPVTADVTFKNCAQFSTQKTEINDVFIDETNYIYIAMPMYKLIEYSDNYSDTSESLWQFKRDDIPNNNADLTADNSQLFKYKATLVGKTANAVNNTNSSVKNTPEM